MTTSFRTCLCLTLIALLTTAQPQPGVANSARGEREQSAEKGMEVADATLNKVYQQLLGKIDAPSQKHVREAQRAWLAFRDAQAQAHSGLTSRDGSFSTDEFVIEVTLELTNARIEELRKMIAEIETR